jgi:hypothetical protein
MGGGGSGTDKCPKLTHHVLSRPLLPARRGPQQPRWQRSHKKQTEKHEQIDELKSLLLRLHLDTKSGTNTASSAIDVAQLLSDIHLSDSSRAQISEVLAVEGGMSVISAPPVCTEVSAVSAVSAEATPSYCDTPMAFGAQNPILR